MPIVDYHIKISKPVFIRSKTFQSPVNRNNYRSWYETDTVTVWSHFAFLYNPNFAKYGHYVFSTVKNMNKVFIQSRDSVSRHFHVLKPERNETASEIDKMKIRNKRNHLVVQTLWFAYGLKVLNLLNWLCNTNQWFLLLPVFNTLYKIYNSSTFGSLFTFPHKKYNNFINLQ